MTKQDAHQFLDAVCAGARATQKEITQALWVTGDLTRRREEEPAPQLTASHQWPFYATETGQQEAA